MTEQMMEIESLKIQNTNLAATVESQAESLEDALAAVPALEDVICGFESQEADRQLAYSLLQAEGKKKDAEKHQLEVKLALARSDNIVLGDKVASLEKKATAVEKIVEI